MLFSHLFRTNKEVIPEVLWAFKNKLPQDLQIEVQASEDGGYVARVMNLPGCFTEGDTFQQLNEMLNAAVYDYFQVPEQYIPYLRSYGPAPEIVSWMAAHGDQLPENSKVLTLQGV